METSNCETLREINSEEERYAKKLRGLCTRYGDEKESKLKETTEVIYEIGRLRLRKAGLEKGMVQKLNFIQAAALLHGARVRCRKFPNSEEVARKIHDALDDMENLLMKKCSGTLPRSLLETSRRVQQAFEALRSDEKDLLNSLEIIEEGLPDDVERRIKNKVEDIKKLLKNNSENYVQQMRSLSESCEKILGSPPCGFAIVGLGSLAREEATLYSDFEHVIILEEGVQRRDDYKKILEYFRWFSVVFHVLVIGIGETVIPGVGVENLNDLSSNDESKNWFFDSFTPPGVSFDPMMPHASKIPIGRQIITQKNNSMVELIKPVKQMASYLTRQEDIKNGYCLKDVLSETCFVYGSRDVYDHFQIEAGSILIQEKEKNSFAAISRTVAKNANSFVRNHELLSGTYQALDMKSAFYRPLSVLLGYLCRYKGTGGNSGFDKIKNLCECPQESGPLSTIFDEKSLSWAFAVVCELRMKIYAAYFGNRRKYFGREILEFVGKSCLVNCTSMIDNLSHYLNSLEGEIGPQKWIGAELRILLFLGEDAEARKIILSLIEQEPLSMIGLSENFIQREHVLELAMIYHREYKFAKAVERSDYLKSLDKAEDVLRELLKYDWNPLVCIFLVKVLNAKGHYQEAMDHSDEILEKFDLERFTLFQRAIFWHTHLRAMKGTLEPNDFIEHCKEQLSENEDFLLRLEFKLALATAQNELGCKDEARSLTENLVKMCRTSDPKKYPQDLLVRRIRSCQSLQRQEGWADDFDRSEEAVKEVTETRCKKFKILQAPLLVNEDCLTEDRWYEVRDRARKEIEEYNSQLEDTRTGFSAWPAILIIVLIVINEYFSAFSPNLRWI